MEAHRDQRRWPEKESWLATAIRRGIAALIRRPLQSLIPSIIPSRPEHE
jgi:hypothetical protein